MAWAVRYYADGAALTWNYRWWAALRGALWHGQLGRQTKPRLLATQLQMVGDVEGNAVAWAVR